MIYVSSFCTFNSCSWCKMKKLFRYFLWMGQEGPRWHSLAWGQVCTRRAQGGLGIVGLCTKAKCHTLKWRQKLEESTPWCVIPRYFIERARGIPSWKELMISLCWKGQQPLTDDTSLEECIWWSRLVREKDKAW